MPPAPAPLTRYQRLLFVFLGVASFFEGYDFVAITQILPALRRELGLSPSQAGVLLGFINTGTIVAALLVRKADRWGRRRVLMVTIAGYTALTALTGLAPGAWSFGLLQLGARVFLIGEWAVSVVYAAEEYPAARRGMVIGVLQFAGSLGGIACAALAPALLATRWGWRSVYFVGVLPLVALGVARRGLRETERFLARGPGAAPSSLRAILRGPYRRRVLQLAAIWGATYLCTQTALTFWKQFAVEERGFTDGQVGAAIAIAAVVSMPMIACSGKLLDVVGRRAGAAAIFALASAGVAASYTLTGRGPLTAALVLCIFGISAVLPVLNTYTTELFPTEIRGDAFALSNNLLGRFAYVLAPVAVGFAAERVGWGPAVASTAIFPLLALAAILALFPETRGRELEETSSL